MFYIIQMFWNERGGTEIGLFGPTDEAQANDIAEKIREAGLKSGNKQVVIVTQSNPLPITIVP